MSLPLKGIASYQPGQYTSIKVHPQGKEYEQIRQYSLSDTPGHDYYRISLKRETGLNGNPDGVISNFFHRDVQEGDVVQISAPAGVFTLDTLKMWGVPAERVHFKFFGPAGELEADDTTVLQKV